MKRLTAGVDSLVLVIKNQKIRSRRDFHDVRRLTCRSLFYLLYPLLGAAACTQWPLRTLWIHSLSGVHLLLCTEAGVDWAVPY